MAKQTTNWTADSGAVYDNEFDALRDDLRGYFFQATSNEAISRAIVDKLCADLPDIAHTISRLAAVRPQQTLPLALDNMSGMHPDNPMLRPFYGTPRPLAQLGPRKRCMGPQGGCTHRVGECTADPEYQARIKLDRATAGDPL